MNTLRRRALVSSASPAAINADRDWGMPISFGRPIVAVGHLYWPCAAETRMRAFYEMAAEHGVAPPTVDVTAVAS